MECFFRAPPAPSSATTASHRLVVASYHCARAQIHPQYNQSLRGASIWPACRPAVTEPARISRRRCPKTRTNDENGRGRISYSTPRHTSRHRVGRVRAGGLGPMACLEETRRKTRPPRELRFCASALLQRHDQNERRAAARGQRDHVQHARPAVDQVARLGRDRLRPSRPRDGARCDPPPPPSAAILCQHATTTAR